MDYRKDKEGKPKIFQKTFYYVRMHAQHVEKGGCGDKNTIFSQWHSGYNSKIATPA